MGFGSLYDRMVRVAGSVQAGCSASLANHGESKLGHIQRHRQAHRGEGREKVKFCRTMDAMTDGSMEWIK